MVGSWLKKSLAAAAGLGLLMGAQIASAGAVIESGNARLGVHDFGNLIDLATGVGVQHVPSGREAISPGCFCEGWGVGIDATNTGGASHSNFPGGTLNLALDSFASTATTATSVVRLNVGGSDVFRVTHSFAPSASPDLFEVVVSIENISGSDVADLLYRRVMDWDVEPTAFSEFVTIGGLVAGDAVLRSHDNGFASVVPFTADSPLDPATLDVNFVDNGAADHGAFFEFSFGALAAGATKTFSIFYGASANQSAADVARAVAGVEIFSYGQNSLGGVPGNDDVTFVFGFSGVGGVAPPPPGDIPEPSTIVLWSLGGLGMLVIARRRNKKAAA